MQEVATPANKGFLKSPVDVARQITCTQYGPQMQHTPRAMAISTFTNTSTFEIS